MVSQSTSSPQKAPSYADLAKKAQNTRAPIAPPPPNPPPTESPSPSSPNTLKIIDPHNDAPLDSLAPTPTDAPDEPAKTSSLNDLATKALSVVAAHTAPQKNPIVNFWDARKEQMAAARTAQQQPNSHPTTLQNTLHDKSTSTEARSPSKTTAPTKQFASNGSYPGSGPSAGTPNNTRHTGARPVDDDPFVIRISPKPPIPPAIDADSWPEVGKPVSSAHLGGPPVTGESNHPQHEANKIDHPPQIAQSHSRKSEKTKWVAIPPQELQATADAFARASKRHQHPPPRTNNHNTNGSGRQARSGPQSASHSRMQSRSGSVQSSPRLDRQKRLQGEEGVAINGQATPNQGDDERSSGETSPLIVRPHLQPRHQAAISTTPPSNQVSHLPTTTERRHPHQPHVHHQPVSYSIPAYGPDLFVAYDPQRPTTYPQYMHASTGFQSSGDGTPPLPGMPYAYPQTAQGYPGYGPLGYGQNARVPYDYQAHMGVPHGMTQYGYWGGHGSQSGSGYHSPVYAPQAPSPSAGYVGGQGYHPPSLDRQQKHERSRPRERHDVQRQGTTSTRRPPPPGESLPVAGYHGDSAEGEEEGERKVIFGSIEDGRCPSSPMMGVGADEHAEGEGEKTGEGGKQFLTPVSIGVSSGDVHLPRSRTHSGGVNGAIELTDAEGGETKWKFGTATTMTTAESVSGEEGDAGSLSPLSDKPPIDTSILDGSHHGSGAASRASYEQLPPILGSAGTTTTTSSSSAIMNQGASSSPSELHKRLEQLSGVPPLAELDDPGRDVFEVKDFGFGFGSGSRSRESVSPPQQDHQARVEVGGEVPVPVPVPGHDVVVEGENVGYRERESRDMEVPGRMRRGSAPNPVSGGYGPPSESGGYNSRRGWNAYGRGKGGHRRGYNPTHPGQQRPPFTVTPSPGLFRPIVPSMSMGGEPNGYYPTFNSPSPQIPGLPPRGAYTSTGYDGYLGAPTWPRLTTGTVPTTTTTTSGGSGGLPPRLAHAHAAAAVAVTPVLPVASAPPVPVPVSPITQPLDPMRWYLLGQLEYYMSPQNLAQDFFLRQRMDSRGWVPIALIASFNRVKQFGASLQVVKEVLMLSSVVLVKDEWVRMIGWEQFVLPDAAKSTVEEEEEEYATPAGVEDPQGAIADADHGPLEGVYYDHSGKLGHGSEHHQGQEGDVETQREEAADEIEDDDEEDVVFVVSHEASRSTSWSPSHHT